MQGTPSPVRPLLAASGSSPDRMEIPLAEGRFVQQQAAPPLPPAAAAAGPIIGRSSSPHSETVSTDAAEYSEHARLVSSALSDDGMTPLIHVRREAGRWRVLAHVDLGHCCLVVGGPALVGRIKPVRYHAAPCICPSALQPARTRKQKLLLFCKRLLGFVLSHWSKVVILGIIITLIVLVSIKARRGRQGCTLRCCHPVAALMDRQLLRPLCQGCLHRDAATFAAH